MPKRALDHMATLLQPPRLNYSIIVLGGATRAREVKD